MNRTLFAFFITALSILVAVLSTLLVLRTNDPVSSSTDNIQTLLHTVVDTVGPAIVSITGTSSGPDGTIMRQGTGIIVGSRGSVLTNKHLISEGFTYTVQLSDMTTQSAVVTKSHPTLDLALLTLVSESPLSLPVGTFIASQARVRSGDIVISIGNTLGLYPQSISQGVISGIKRTVSLGDSTLTGLIQTSIPLSLGSSGGPLISTDGKIIGINTALVGGSSQIGWALPLTQDEVDAFLQ